ncbi:hypothetical protein [Pectinatus frisingensis]|uniref:hypothetical protein n=1 Tax=Pectinatus frisingensis TaxID=865 RepID=UPI0015F5AAA9|nr:hypothetical protein [Pectinatus frisingensis]
MSYYFFIDTMMLPVPPPKMSIKVNNKNKTINLINEGEVNIIKEAGLTEISFDARLPNSKYPFANYDTSLANSLTNSLLGSNFTFKKADYFLDNFKTAKKSKNPVRLIISRMSPSYIMLFDTNMLVTLENYTINEDAKEGFDIIVPLKFKQYKPYGTKECEVTTDENGVQHLTVKENRAATDMVTPTVYKIRNEQSIWEVCKSISGGNLDWRTVMVKNAITNPVEQMVKGTVLNLV